MNVREGFRRLFAILDWGYRIVASLLVVYFMLSHMSVPRQTFAVTGSDWTTQVNAYTLKAAQERAMMPPAASDAHPANDPGPWAPPQADEQTRYSFWLGAKSALPFALSLALIYAVLRLLGVGCKWVANGFLAP